jgi:malonyl-ACP decarboxylase
MPGDPRSVDPVVSGVGVTTAIGQGRQAFLGALLAGAHRFDVMQREGRQPPAAHAEARAARSFLGAEIDRLSLPEAIALPRGASWTAQVALTTLHEAWGDAALDGLASDRIGLVVGGSNVQQRELVCVHDAYRGREAFVRPTYALSFMDSDVCGVCTEAFGIRGFAHTVGGASASGQIAVIEAVNAVESGRVDACIALGALMDLSYWECQALRSIGAMGSDRHAEQPALACRPFDRHSDGFIYGEACGAVVVESMRSAVARGCTPYARIAGCATRLDANRNPNPSVEGEVAAIGRALSQAGLAPAEIDYVNPHGTGSPIGDAVELESLRRAGLGHVRLNATKALVGHGLSAAGAVELIAVVLQMQAMRLHPTRNLDDPIDGAFDWVRGEPAGHVIQNALNLSMGFGGVNSVVCLRRCQ